MKIPETQVATSFKVDDIVIWSGAQGKVIRIGMVSEEYPVKVSFGPHVELGAMTEIGFLADGRFYDFHTEPSIVKVETTPKGAREVSN